MEIVRSAGELRAARRRMRDRGERVGFVPTMGALHEGHLALVWRARQLAGRAIVSVFVNPAQFGPAEDLSRYPRQPERDAELVAGTGCDLLFLPAVDTIYPPGHSTFVEPGGAALGLEGDRRPGHFRGVATVVTALFHLVEPDLAVFGEKDAQQLAVVRQLARDLHFPVEIVGHPTVREPDGLAMSSRNAFLDPEERRAASVLYRALEAARAELAAGERRAEVLKTRMLGVLAAEPQCIPDYAEVVAAETFQPIHEARGRVVLPIAARLGATRLIDNLQLEVAS